MLDLVEEKKDVEVVNSRLFGSIRAYFIRGHGGWLLYMIWFLSNIAILYVLLGSQMAWIYQLVPNIFMFGAIFVVSYIIIAIIIGYIDVEIRGIFGAEQDVYLRTVPTYQKLITSAENIVELKKSVDEIKTILEQLIITKDGLFKDKELTLQNVMLESIKKVEEK